VARRSVGKGSSTPGTNVGSGKKPVPFECVDPGARTVAVADGFNQWNAGAQPLARDSGGPWAVSVKPAAGPSARKERRGGTP